MSKRTRREFLQIAGVGGIPGDAAAAPRPACNPPVAIHLRWHRGCIVRSESSLTAL